MPDVKLIFLMRDPVARAWSHAKHNHHFREANFAACGAAIEEVTDSQWCENFTHDWPLASGDYLGQPGAGRRSYPARLYVGFYESIAARPESLLRALFAFLGVNPDVDLSGFHVSERVLPGPSRELPAALQRFLHSLLHDRTRELASFLRERFHLEPPPEWGTTLEAPRTLPNLPIAAHRRRPTLPPCSASSTTAACPGFWNWRRRSPPRRS